MDYINCHNCKEDCKADKIEMYSDKNDGVVFLCQNCSSNLKLEGNE